MQTLKMIINRIFPSVVLLLTASTLGGCYDSLNQEVVTALTKDQVDKEYEYRRYQVTYLYNGLENGRTAVDNAMLACICDEAEYTYSGDADKFNTGAWNEYDNPDDVWDEMFTYIRYANDFLTSGNKVDLEAYRKDPDPNSQKIYETRMADLANYEKEARFLRAYYYFELIKRYGGVPLLYEMLDLDSDFGSIKRNTLQECVDFITKECTDLMDEDNGLPLSYNAENSGRATCVAAAALKSRVLLYAASKLWNDAGWVGGYAQSSLVSMDPVADIKTRWKAAADAAEDCIALASKAGLSLNADYSTIGMNPDSPETILCRRESPSNSFEKANFPIGYTVGDGSITPSQNLVDAYEMTDGRQFDWTDPQMASDPYGARDPRMGKTVYYNGSKFRETVIATYVGGRNGRGVPDATKTGYYLKKFVDESLDLLQDRSSYHCWPVFRLAEIYLNGAEALNECDPSNPAVVQYLNMCRQRQGVGMPPVSDRLSQSEMREAIRHERRIELAFEGHRYWDVKRWMIAGDVLNAPIYGVEIQGETDPVYRRIEVEPRTFTSKMYFYPIPQKILSVSSVDWPQNPLW